MSLPFRRYATVKVLPLVLFDYLLQRYEYAAAGRRGGVLVRRVWVASMLCDPNGNPRSIFKVSTQTRTKR
jgi:hypothetical protein